MRHLSLGVEGGAQEVAVLGIVCGLGWDEWGLLDHWERGRLSPAPTLAAISMGAAEVNTATSRATNNPWGQ